jgi:hypothetical protein
MSIVLSTAAGPTPNPRHLGRISMQYPSVLDPVELSMSDEKEAVKYTAAAAVLRLMAIKESGLPVMERKKGKEKK